MSGRFRESIFSTYGKKQEKGRPQIAINWQHPFYKTEKEFEEDSKCDKIVWKKKWELDMEAEKRR